MVILPEKISFVVLLAYLILLEEGQVDEDTDAGAEEDGDDDGDNHAEFRAGLFFVGNDRGGGVGRKIV